MPITRIERLVYRGRRKMLWISKKIPRSEFYQPSDVMAMGFDEKKIAYGNHEICRVIEL
jgi:hypothetical protein